MDTILNKTRHSFKQNCYLSYKNCTDYYTIPAIISWKIWNVTTISSFYDQVHDLNIICMQILNLVKEFGTRKDKPTSIKEFQQYGVFGYIDGAAKEGLCAVGLVLLLNNSHTYTFTLNCGS